MLQDLNKMQDYSSSAILHSPTRNKRNFLHFRDTFNLIRLGLN